MISYRHQSSGYRLFVQTTLGSTKGHKGKGHHHDEEAVSNEPARVVGACTRNYRQLEYGLVSTQTTQELRGLETMAQKLFRLQTAVSDYYLTSTAGGGTNGGSVLEAPVGN